MDVFPLDVAAAQAANSILALLVITLVGGAIIVMRHYVHY